MSGVKFILKLLLGVSSHLTDPSFHDIFPPPLNFYSLGFLTLQLNLPSSFRKYVALFDIQLNRLIVFILGDKFFSGIEVRTNISKSVENSFGRT